MKTQCIIKITISMRKKLTKSSILFMSRPPVEKIIGRLVSAIFSIRGQSLAEQLATLIISKFISFIISTDSSSKGVHIVIIIFLTSLNKVLYCSWLSSVDLNLLSVYVQYFFGEMDE